MSKIFSILFIVLFVLACGQQGAETPSMVRSLTGDNFSGQKHYFGWGAAARGDPSMMHNEVKYDVLHTHDIFTDKVGGNYVGTKETGTHVNGSLITNEWQRIGADMTEEDMYVQYSSGHGYSTGLAVGVTYDEIRDNALSYPAKEVIIFTMACKSGGLVDSFNRRRTPLPWRLRHLVTGQAIHGREFLVPARRD